MITILEISLVVRMSIMLYVEIRPPSLGSEQVSISLKITANQCSVSNRNRTQRTRESCCGEEGFVPEDKVLNLPVSLRSNSFLWSQALGSDQKQLSERLELASQVRWPGRVRSSDIGREPGVELLLLHVEKSQLRWFGFQDASWAPLIGGYILLGGGLKIDAEYGREIIYFIWSGNASR